MSKKIIYLLSLLMALSLVFASCKKNGAGDISGTVPDNGFDNSPDTDNGLAGDSTWLDQNSEKPIKNEQIPFLQSVGGQAYFRNPVVVVMGDTGSDVVVFSEKRYKSLGAGNDIGIDGKTAVDIVYSSSTDSGKKWNPTKIVGNNGGTEATPEKAYASPVVFKVDNTTVVVVASSGVGLSRTETAYDTRVQNGQSSKLVYTIGKYSSGSFTWKEWIDMTDTVKDKAAAINNGNFNYKQFAVHSGRGFINGSDLYFAVSVSDQGTTVNGQVKEAMGNLIVKGNNVTDSSITWAVVDNSGIGFNDTKNNYSKYKESRVIGMKGTDPEYIAVGSPYYVNNNVGCNVKGNQPVETTIPGSEGSPAYLKVEKWYGQASYNPTTYNSENPNKSQRLFAHVKSQNNTIIMYALNGDDGLTSTGKPYTVIGYPTDTTTLAKSSSMDVLGDGTIIMVAEQGGATQVYNVVFKRFTQKFLATQLGLN
ncbi:sialidase family protein [Brachyspira pilosicoli]|uniref:sialidase family protein n=1 Tax=Brachyspira pilosicoli TaxID=52584 RepID=UPI0012F4FD7E|nr:sialidase family protein [Brachyspira pilosicoli]